MVDYAYFSFGEALVDEFKDALDLIHLAEVEAWAGKFVVHFLT